MRVPSNEVEEPSGLRGQLIDAAAAQRLNTSLDHLVFDNIPHRPLHTTANHLDALLTAPTTTESRSG